MGQDYGCGAKAEGWREDFPGLQGRHIQATNRHLLAAYRLVSRIQVEHREALPGAVPEILELQEGLPWGGDRRCGAVGGNVPAKGQLPDHEQPPDLAGTQAVAPSSCPQLLLAAADHRALG